jgi:hypothetical protein
MRGGLPFRDELAIEISAPKEFCRKKQGPSSCTTLDIE